VRRGDVFWADLVPRSRSEQRGTRPVIVVSHDGFNQTPAWRSVIVVPLTTSARRGRGPTVVALPAGAGGLPAGSTALCHQVTTLDRAKLTRHLGALTAEQMNEVDRALAAALDLPSPP
jgi:mRNA interferase MazF